MMREISMAGMVSGILEDSHYALRQLRRNLGFTVVAILTLGLGIGANTAIFSVVNAVLLRPLPYKDDSRLVVILEKGRNPVAPANFLDWRDQNHVFEQMGAAEYWTPNLTGRNNPEKLWALHVSPATVAMLGVQPLLGRAFLPEEDETGKENEVLLSFSLWQSHFAGDPGIVGQSVALSGQTYTVVGVMPRQFKFAPFWATKAELWAPLAFGARQTDRGGASLRVFARLKPGVTLQQAQAEMAGITGRLEREFPGTNQDIEVLPLREKVVGNVRPALLVLVTAVGFVLLIACANVSHMLLARSTARQKETALRSALGAGRWAVMRQFLTESLLLALFGGGAGLLLAIWGVRVLLALGPADIPRVDTVGVDAPVLLFALGISLLTGVVFGLAPAWRGTSVNLSDALKQGERGSSDGLARNRFSGLLVASEFAMAVVLLAGAGLMIRSFFALEHVDPGFDPHNLLSMVVGVAGTEEQSAGHTGNFYKQVLLKVKAAPGVQSVGAINHLPLAGDEWGLPFHVEGRAATRPGEEPGATYRVVFPGYFRTMRIPILRGRDVAEADDLGAPGVVVINDYLARRYWPGEEALGKRITFNDPGKNPSWLTVVGVVKNTVRGSWISPPAEEVFLPYLQNREYLENPSPPFAYLTLVIRTGSNPAAAAPAIRGAVHSLDKNVPLSEVQTMDQVVAEATAQSRFYVVLLGAFAVVALVLAGVGIYGVMSYSVSRRTREIGIRMALGAHRRDVLELIVLRGMAPALAGVAAGVAGGLALTRLMSSLLFATPPSDPLTFGAVVVMLSGVAVAASYWPARRASGVDPMVALRCE
jgi:putative ABC transport system permease protein